MMQRRVLALPSIVLAGAAVLALSGCAGTPDLADSAEEIALPGVVADGVGHEFEQAYLVGEAGGVTYAAIPIDDDTDDDICFAMYRDEAADDQWMVGCAQGSISIQADGLGDALLDLDGVPEDPDDGTRLSDWVVVHG